MTGRPIEKKVGLCTRYPPDIPRSHGYRPSVRCRLRNPHELGGRGLMDARRLHCQLNCEAPCSAPRSDRPRLRLRQTVRLALGHHPQRHLRCRNEVPSELRKPRRRSSQQARRRSVLCRVALFPREAGVLGNSVCRDCRYRSSERGGQAPRRNTCARICKRRARRPAGNLCGIDALIRRAGSPP